MKNLPALELAKAKVTMFTALRDILKALEQGSDRPIAHVAKLKGEEIGAELFAAERLRDSLTEKPVVAA